MKRILSIFALSSLLLAACQDELQVSAPSLTPEQEALIGRAVNFNTSHAAQFESRITYIDNGGFNEGDRMRIFRNYWKEDNSGWETVEAYRTYHLVHRYAGGIINLGTDWQAQKGHQGFDDKDLDGTYETFEQTESDSLTWDNGRTLRFRAWSLSNYANVLLNANKDRFYPDFCIADWVNASGPTLGIPLVLNHQGSRLAFKVKQSGNQFSHAMICTELADYKRKDNASSNKNDTTEFEAGKTDAQADAELKSVMAVYNRMCMPAGVNMENGTLKAVLNAEWDKLSNAQVQKLDEQDESIFLKYGEHTAQEVAANAKRPNFCGVNGSLYMISIPYDISDGATKGEVLVLPACTRFRVYLYDVNNGDENNTLGYEGSYHIFALSDAKDANDKPAFPNGLKLEAGVSYTFHVGYRYNAFHVVVDKSLSWDEQDAIEDNGQDEVQQQPTSTTADYKWWKQAIENAIPKDAQHRYDPVFEISNEKEFLEFINLVNNTAALKTDTLYRLVKAQRDTTINGKPQKVNVYGWSKNNSKHNPEWIETAEAEKEGYLFYQHYYPANADRAAYADEDYIRGPFSFYDDNLNRNFRIKLTADLDLKDWALTSIGDSLHHRFMGKFDGQGHVLRNLYMKNEYLFGYMNGLAPEGASVTNLRIESTHNTCVLNQGVNAIYLAGISVLAPSSGCSLAKSLTFEADRNGTSHVVGCIHVGDAKGALVGNMQRGKVQMFGCMQAAAGISGGALVGNDDAFDPQIKISQQLADKKCDRKPAFSAFMCNYYDTTLSPAAKAVGNVADDYSLLEYIRGRSTDILRAKNDFLIEGLSMLQLIQRSDYKDYYGLAPWHAMNYAIYWYNKNRGSNHKVTMHFESNNVGYKHQYPTLVGSDPENDDPENFFGKDDKGNLIVTGWDPTDQPN